MKKKNNAKFIETINNHNKWSSFNNQQRQKQTNQRCNGRKKTATQSKNEKSSGHYNGSKSIYGGNEQISYMQISYMQNR